MFTTMADDDDQPSYLDTNASGVVVDLAIKDEVVMAHACHYVMVHTADKLYNQQTQSTPKKAIWP
jgi:hypothetical protein